MQPQKALQSDAQQGNSFTLQLFQRTLEETLDSFQRSIHDDMRNLHLEILRQFHMQEVLYFRFNTTKLEQGFCHLHFLSSCSVSFLSRNLCTDGNVKCDEHHSGKSSRADQRGQVSKERKPAASRFAWILGVQWIKFVYNWNLFFFQRVLRPFCCSPRR